MGREQERLCSEAGAVSANRKYFVMSLPATTPTAMRNVKKEDVVVVKEVDWSVVELSCTAEKVYEGLKQAMKSV